MTDTGTPGGTPPSMQPTQQLPRIEPGPPAGQPPGPPPAPETPSKPGWVWALLGALVAVLLLGGLWGAFALGRRAQVAEQAEATSTVSGMVTSTVETTLTEDIEDADADGGSGGGAEEAAADEAGDEADEAAAEEEPADEGEAAGAGDEPAAEEAISWRMVTRIRHGGPWTSGAIRLGPGHRRERFVIDRGTGGPLRVEVRRNDGPWKSWWETASSRAGQRASRELEISTAASYRWRVVCDPAAIWVLGVEWSP